MKRRMDVIAPNPEGFDAALAALKSLSDEAELRGIMDTALAAGGRVIADEWSRRAPAQSLKGTQVRKGKRASRALKIRNIGGLAVVGFTGKGYRLAHLFEYGTAERYQKTTGRYTGRMPMTPFARPGVDAVRGEVSDKILASMKRSMKRLAKKKT